MVKYLVIRVEKTQVIPKIQKSIELKNCNIISLVFSRQKTSVEEPKVQLPRLQKCKITNCVPFGQDNSGILECILVDNKNLHTLEHLSTYKVSLS